LKKILLSTILLSFIFASSIFSQNEFYKNLKGTPTARKKNVHSGNQVRTTFFNYGLIGRLNSAEDFGGEWPINSGHFYIGDISIMVGAEIELPDGTIIHPVTVSDGPRGNNEVNPNDPLDFWGWEPIPGFNNDDTTLVAMSHQSFSWPAVWPDRETDPLDPGWPGAWNGFFGKDQFNADQESYFWMDDTRDKEFTQGYSFFPDSTDSTRGGLALISSVRGLQWSQIAAQNTVFWLYEITNVGTTDYDKSVFGMIVGTTIGGDGDTNDDNSFFDVTQDLTYSWDFDNIGNTGWSPVGYLGYAFLESPGNGVNGIDDDGDGSEGPGPIIDESILTPRIAQAGDPVVLINYSSGHFERTVSTLPDTGITIHYNSKSFHIDPGDSLIEKPFNNVDDNLNGLIDENTEIAGDGIDNNGNGLVDEENPDIGLKYIDYFQNTTNLNPLIDETRDDGIDNDNDWDATVDDVGLDGKPNTGDFGEGDGRPTSGFQPGPGGRLVDTGLPGEPNIDKTDVDESDQIGLTSFFFFFPFNKVRLFDDEQLWGTLRPGFFSVTRQDVDGDFIYGTGYFPLLAKKTERISLAFFFGDNLDQIFNTKKTVQIIFNGNYNFAKAPLLPLVKAVGGDHEVRLYWNSKAENSFDRLSLLKTGNGFDFEGYKLYRATFPTFDETGVVTDAFGSRVSDVPIKVFDLVDEYSGFFPKVTDGSVFYLGDNSGLVHSYVDTTVNNGFTYFYAVTAYDHGIADEDIFPAETSKFAAINTGGKVVLGQNVVQVTPEAPAAGFVGPKAMENLEHSQGDGTGQVLVDPFDASRIKDGHTYEISFKDDGAFLRKTESFSVVDVTTGDTLVRDNPEIDIDATVFDGIKLNILNDWTTRGDFANVHWIDSTRNIVKPSFWGRFASGLIQGKAYPASYEIEVGEPGVDTTSTAVIPRLPALPAIPVNFRVKNVSENRYVEFKMFEFSNSGGPEPPEDRGKLDANDVVLILEFDNNTPVLTYGLRLSNDSTAVAPEAGDVLELPVRKPFLNEDKFRFNAEGAKENKQIAKSELDRIKVVPNPYIATAIWEPRNNFTNGRGDRSLHFIHLPKDCTIRIYNVKGELVDTINHHSSVIDGTAKWDMLDSDRLDISYGIYIYHVQAPGIGEKVGKFAVIK